MFAMVVQYGPVEHVKPVFQQRSGSATPAEIRFLQSTERGLCEYFEISASEKGILACTVCMQFLGLKYPNEFYPVSLLRF